MEVRGTQRMQTGTPPSSHALSPAFMLALYPHPSPTPTPTLLPPSAVCCSCARCPRGLCPASCRCRGWAAWAGCRGTARARTSSSRSLASWSRVSTAHVAELEVPRCYSTKHPHVSIAAWCLPPPRFQQLLYRLLVSILPILQYAIIHGALITSSYRILCPQARSTVWTRPPARPPSRSCSAARSSRWSTTRTTTRPSRWGGWRGRVVRQGRCLGVRAG